MEMENNVSVFTFKAGSRGRKPTRSGLDMNLPYATAAVARPKPSITKERVSLTISTE
jgi:hypothetical protein